VATDPLGNFIVAWADEFSGSPPEWGLSGRRFASNGAPLGAEFRVNTSTTVGNYDPAIAVDAAGTVADDADRLPAALAQAAHVRRRPFDRLRAATQVRAQLPAVGLEPGST